MKKFILISLIALFASVQNSFAGILEDLVDQSWQPEVAYFGRVGWDFCVLTISEDRLSFSDSNASSMPYTTLINNDKFAILEVDAIKTDCFNPKAIGKTYWRIDTEAYFICRTSKNKSACPEPLKAERKFEISVFEKLSEAKKYSAEPIGWHGFYQYLE